LAPPPKTVYVEDAMPPRSRHRRATDSRRRALGRALAGTALGLLAVGFWSIEPDRAEAKEGAPKGKFEYGCRLQRPQKFLERRPFLTNGILDSAKPAHALRYFAEHYGNAGDDTTTRWNAESATSQTKAVKFFGLPLAVHAKIAPALACVEKRIRKTCRG